MKQLDCVCAECTLGPKRFSERADSSHRRKSCTTLYRSYMKALHSQKSCLKLVCSIELGHSCTGLILSKTMSVKIDQHRVRGVTSVAWEVWEVYIERRLLTETIGSLSCGACSSNNTPHGSLYMSMFGYESNSQRGGADVIHNHPANHNIFIQNNCWIMFWTR